MKAVILAGGLGTRLAEETSAIPKPMVEIGNRPIIWHIMKIYAKHGITDFIVCCGYKGEVLKDYFLNYMHRNKDFTISLRDNHIAYHSGEPEDWRVTLVDTGPSSMTGGRLLAVKKYLDGETFCFTYGDGVGDVHITNALEFHRSHGKLATMTVAKPPGRFGAVIRNGDEVIRFQEKPDGDEGFINAGFFILEQDVFKYIENLSTTWEQEPLESLATEKNLMSFVHDGFWQPMDTLRDKQKLNQIYDQGDAPWLT